MEQAYRLTSYNSGSGHPIAPQDSQSSRDFSIPRKLTFSVNDAESAQYALISSPNNAAGGRFERRSGSDFFLRWWIPEIFSSFLSVAALLSLVLVLRHYDSRGINQLNLPYSLTLNGIVAAISTVNRVALMVPVGSAMSQEAWLWFSMAKQSKVVRSQLRDLEISDAASRGAWGSLVFLCKARSRYISQIELTL